MDRLRREETIEAEAMEFLAKFHESERAAGADEVAQFREWLTRSPLHVETFLAVAATWHLLSVTGAAQSPDLEQLIALAREENEKNNVVLLPRFHAPEIAEPGRGARFTRLAAAAVLAVLAVGVGWYASVIYANTYRNSGSEVRRIQLQDGSVVALNPNSEIYLRWTAAERRLELKNGRARFQVAKNPNRPFLVQTATSTVRAVGTIFDVETHAMETKITVIEGKVAVESAPAKSARPAVSGARAAPSTLQLSAGDRAAVNDETAGRGAQAVSMMAWTSQQVVFRDTPLSEVVDELNRYQAQRVVLDDSELATLLISGVFDPRDPESLLQYLQIYEGVHAKPSDGSILLSRADNEKNN